MVGINEFSGTMSCNIPVALFVLRAQASKARKTPNNRYLKFEDCYPRSNVFTLKAQFKASGYDSETEGA